MMSSSTPTSTSPFPETKIQNVVVPPMAIGTWSWGDKLWGWKDEDYEKAKASWDACNSHGLTFYDTAEVYGEGESERVIGRLIKESDPAVGDKIYIATKFLPFPRPASFFLFSPPLVRQLRRSLERLDLPSVDLYMVHSPTGPHSFRQLADGLAECHKLGLAKAVGVSNFSLSELIKFSDLLAERNVPLACNQVEFSLLRKMPETTGLLAEMKKRNIAMLAYSPLGMGRLTGKYDAAHPPPPRRRFGGGQTWEELDPLIGELKRLAGVYGVTPSAVALNWVMCKGAIPLGGARDGQQARENALANSFRLTEDEVAGLGAVGFEGSTTWYWQHG